jgi:hypothetical protein
MLGHEIGMLTEPVARSFDLDHDGMVEQPIEQCGGHCVFRSNVIADSGRT